MSTLWSIQCLEWRAEVLPRIVAFVNHPRPVVLRSAIEQEFRTIVGRKKGAASYSVFRSNAKEESWKGRVSTATLRLVASVWLLVGTTSHPSLGGRGVNGLRA